MHVWSEDEGRLFHSNGTAISAHCVHDAEVDGHCAECILYGVKRQLVTAKACAETAQRAEQRATDQCALLVRENAALLKRVATIESVNHERGPGLSAMPEKRPDTSMWFYDVDLLADDA